MEPMPSEWKAGQCNHYAKARCPSPYRQSTGWNTGMIYYYYLCDFSTGLKLSISASSTTVSYISYIQCLNLHPCPSYPFTSIYIFIHLPLHILQLSPSLAFSTSTYPLYSTSISIYSTHPSPTTVHILYLYIHPYIFCMFPPLHHLPASPSSTYPKTFPPPSSLLR